MAEHRWTAYDAIQTALTTELNSLADGNHAISAAIDFTAVNRKVYIDFEVYLASVNLSSSVNPALYIWLLRRTDGTNFEDGASGTPGTNPARPPDAIIPLRAVNSTQRVPGALVLTNPDQAKILVQNKGGAALASSGNTLKYYTYSDQMV